MQTHDVMYILSTRTHANRGQPFPNVVKCILCDVTQQGSTRLRMTRYTLSSVVMCTFVPPNFGY